MHPLPKMGSYSLPYEEIVSRLQPAAETRLRELTLCNAVFPLLISLSGHESPYRGATTIFPALTLKVRDKLFSEHPPTPQQEEAIRVALNTPDIAVIQGPPGTGKTKVIEAIVERLNEELDILGAGAGQILVTGYQHDAVENALLVALM